MKFLKACTGIILILCLLSSCITEPQKVNDQLIVRLSGEPDRLNPILSRGSVASQIENFIFQPLAEIDPVTLDFEPVLLERLPVKVLEIREDLGAVDRLDLRLKENAVWSDGRTITYNDILFTLKAIFNDEVGASRFKTALSFVKAENHDENDTKFISFYLDTAVFNADKIFINFHILPEHIYDSVGYLSDISFNKLLNGDLTVDDNQSLKLFAEQFRLEKFSRTTVIGSGPYELTNWNTGYELKLSRKKEWWGAAYEGNLFKAVPEDIVYKIIPDEQLALTALANDNVHVIAGVNPEKFKVMQQNTPEAYQYLTPEIPQYFYIILNNQSPLLSDVRVRQALAHLVDQPKMIDVVMNGYGKPLTAPLLPDGKYYDSSILPYTFDVARAKELLVQAGWEDMDDNGILDKEFIDGRKDLSLRIYITGSELGRKIALLLQSNMRRAGVDVQIQTQKFNPNSMDDMRSGDFEMVATAARQSFLESNLRPAWHSSGFKRGGGNLSGFINEEVDAVLDDLMIEEDQKKRLSLYNDFHRLIHREVPVLFLLMPTERLLVSNDWETVVSPRRPGYFENLFSQK